MRYESHRLFGAKLVAKGAEGGGPKELEPLSSLPKARKQSGWTIFFTDEEETD
jgi:hypothetical protein